MTAQEWLNSIIRRRAAAATATDKDNQRQAAELCVEIGELAATARNELQPLGYEYLKAYKDLQKREHWASQWYSGLLIGKHTPARSLEALTNIHREATKRAAICDELPRDGLTATPKERQAAVGLATKHRLRAGSPDTDALCRDHGPACADAEVIAILLRGAKCVGFEIDCSKRGGIDHKRPLKWGGLHCKDNLQPMCPECNSRKGARLGTETPSFPAIAQEKPSRQPAYFAIDKLAGRAGRIEVFDSQEEAEVFVAADPDTRLPVKESTLLKWKSQAEVDAYVAEQRAQRGRVADSPPSFPSTGQTVHIARQGGALQTFASLEEALAWVSEGANRHLVSEAALRAKAERAGKDYDAIVADLEARRAQRESNQGRVADGPPLLLPPSVGAASRRPMRMGRRARLLRRGRRSF